MTFNDSWFKNTKNLHNYILQIQGKLNGMKLLYHNNPYFVPEFIDIERESSQLLDTHPINGISDDHVPFWSRGVEILHWIPTPFPKQWHQLEDKTVNQTILADYCKILSVFILVYMEMDCLHKI